MSVALDQATEAFTIDWTSPHPYSDNRLTEVLVVRCSDETGCPESRDDEEAILASQLEWRAFGERHTEVEIPGIAGPIAYPTGVGELDVFGDEPANEPIPAPALAPGARYAAVSFLSANTMAVTQFAHGVVEIDVPER